MRTKRLTKRERLEIQRTMTCREWLAAGIHEPNITLFGSSVWDERSSLEITPGYLHYAHSDRLGSAFELAERDDRAILYFTDDPFPSPLLFRRGSGGWRSDIAGKVDEILPIAHGDWSWSFRPGGAYLATFFDLRIVLHDLIRIRRGANRPLRRGRPRVSSRRAVPAGVRKQPRNPQSSQRHGAGTPLEDTTS